MKKIVLFIFVFLMLANLGWGLIISQNCDPQANYVADRFAEIYNSSDDPVDLTGWTLENVQGGSVSFTWTLSGSIASGEALICGNADATNQTITPDFTATWSGASWNGKGGDGTILKNASGTIIDNAVQADVTGTFENKEMVRNSNITTPTTTYNAAEWTFSPVTNAVDATPGTHVCDLPAGSSPLITLSEISLSGFSYIYGNGPSAEQLFTAQGINLTDNVVITPPTNYEISTETGGSFVATNPLTLSQSGGSVAETTIFVRLKSGLSAGTYNNEDIACSSTDADDKTVTCSGEVFKLEPTNHVVSFVATADGFSKIDLSWTENDGAVVPDGYLIKASTSDNVSNPVDGVAVVNNTTIGDDNGAMNVTHGTAAYEWTGLTAEQIYYFKIYPYTNSGTAIDYKTDGTIPAANATTEAMPPIPELLISEVADPSDNYNARFVEIYNASGSTIDFDSEIAWYISRQSNGGSWGNALLTGSINAGITYIIAVNQTEYETAYSSSAQLYSNIINGNGNDGYFLYYGGDNASGILVDAYGEIDVDGTGEPWEYLDSHAVRNAGVTEPNVVWTASEWTISPATAAQCTPGDSPLPVSLSSFTAEFEADSPILYWTTQSETDNLGWNIYRSLSENGFDEDNYIQNNSEMIPGMGISTEPTDYSFIDEYPVVEGLTYWYWLESVSTTNELELHGPISLEIPIQGEIPHSNLGTALNPNYPNPFNPSTTISFSIEEDEVGILTIYNIKGQDVYRQKYAAGEYHEEWNAEGLSSGIYFYRLQTPTQSITKKMILMK